MLNFAVTMYNEHYEAMMQAHGVKPTANRLLVARALGGAGRPMSLSELESQMLSMDKSSIFRALALFREHHLVHVIEDGGEGVRYELCHSHHDERDDDMHAHFYCERCHRTFCLDYAPVPAIALPSGFEMRTVNYMVKGICGECSEQG